MTRERFEVIQREFEQAIKCQTAFGGVESPLLLWGETIKALEEAWAEQTRLRAAHNIVVVKLDEAVIERDAKASELETTIFERDEAIMENLRLTVEKDGMQTVIEQLRSECDGKGGWKDVIAIQRATSHSKDREIVELRLESEAAIGQRDERALRAAGLMDQVKDLRKGHDRYETARRLSPAQWADAWKLNISTGKPFDEIIDDLRPFVRSREKDTYAVGIPMKYVCTDF